jgi:hypothetical protein
MNAMKDDMKFINEQIRKTPSFDLIKEDDFVSDSAKKKFRELKDQRNNQTR